MPKQQQTKTQMTTNYHNKPAKDQKLQENDHKIPVRTYPLLKQILRFLGGLFHEKKLLVS